MAQYIDKFAVVAEIEKTYNFHKERGCKNDASICDVLYGLLYRINNLEVKGVDLEKEINEWQGREAFPEGVSITPLPKAMEIVERTAKHFFELGLLSQLTWQDIRLIAEIGEDFMNSEESDNLSDEEYYTAILNKLKNKGRDCKTGRQWIRDISKAQKGE